MRCVNWSIDSGKVCRSGKRLMASEVLEIIELEEGGYALRTSAHKGAEPMISIQFSEQAMQEFDGLEAELAKAMMALGVQALVEHREKQLLEALTPVMH